MAISKHVVVRAGLLAGALATSAAASAATTIAGAVTRISPVEQLTAPFTVPGTQTLRAYSGFVEVNVSGSGYSAGSAFNDAFYPGGFGYYTLGLGWSAAPLLPGQPTRAIANSISFIEGVGAVPFGTLPAYNPTPPHAYRFVIDLGALAAQPLQFGVLDGVYADNGGAYDFNLYQLRAGATAGVPEPESWALTIAGFALVGMAARRRRAFA